MSLTDSVSQSAAPDPAVNSSSHRFGDPIVLTLTMGFIALFIGMSIYDTAWLTEQIGSSFAWTAKYMGSLCDGARAEAVVIILATQPYKTPQQISSVGAFCLLLARTQP